MNMDQFLKSVATQYETEENTKEYAILEYCFCNPDSKVPLTVIYNCCMKTNLDYKTIVYYTHPYEYTCCRTEAILRLEFEPVIIADVFGEYAGEAWFNDMLKWIKNDIND